MQTTWTARRTDGETVRIMANDGGITYKVADVYETVEDPFASGPISAALDMLRALEDALKELETLDTYQIRVIETGEFTEVDSVIIRAMRDAIQKAKGK